jgi:stage V sporulation protein AF
LQKTVSKNVLANKERLRTVFPEALVCDVKTDDIKIGKRDALVAFINGSTDTEAMMRIEKSLISLSEEESESCQTMSDFMKNHIPFNDKREECDFDKIISALLLSMSVIFIDGYDSAVILDTKKYPSRSISEPEKNKTLRGPRDGFSENIYTNTALIRRRIKTPNLCFEAFDIGSETKTRVILSYVKGKAREELVARIREKLLNLDVPSLTLSQQTLTDNLFSNTFLKKLNPFPKVRYVERPDTAASMLVEGKVGILCDTTPSSIFLPVTLYDMMEETDDYYFPPVTASYLRLLRVLMLFASVFISPLWLLALSYSASLPPSLEFLLVNAECFIPVWLQLITVEIMIDALKIASLNTPDNISNSLSVVSGLLLSDFAVSAGLLVPQTILYSAIASIANFIPTNYELGYAFKFWRISLIVFVTLFKLWGFVVGVLIFIIIIAFNRTADNRNYLYPFDPRDKKGILKFFIRTDKGKE